MTDGKNVHVYVGSRVTWSQSSRKIKNHQTIKNPHFFLYKDEKTSSSFKNNSNSSKTVSKFPDKSDMIHKIVCNKVHYFIRTIVMRH